MSFPFGFSNISKVTGDEKAGLLIVMIFVMESLSGQESFQKVMSRVHFSSWVSLFQKVLWYSCWMSKDKYDCKTLKAAENNIHLLLATFKAVSSRNEGYGMKIQKFHQQVHGPANIDYFGSPKNVDSRPCEKNLKTHAKAPGRTTQKRGETFHQQCSQRMYEMLVIQQALKDHLGEDITPVQNFESRKADKSSNKANGVGGLQFIVAIKGAGYHGKLTIKVKNSQFSNQIPALSDDIVGFIAKVLVQFCPKMTLTVWSEYRHDGMLFRGHSRFRGGQAWNDWALFEWKNSVLDKDGVSYITTIGIEGKIHGFIDLQDPQSFDFDMFPNSLIPTLQKGRHTIYAIIHSLKEPSTDIFPKSVVRKGELESWGCDGRRGED